MEIISHILWTEVPWGNLGSRSCSVYSGEFLLLGGSSQLVSG